MEAASYSYLPRWSDELSQALIRRTLSNIELSTVWYQDYLDLIDSLASIDPSTMSYQDYSALINYIYYGSPSRYINELLTNLGYTSVPRNYPVPQYLALQPPSYMPYYTRVPQESHGYNPIYFPPMQSYEAMILVDVESSDYEDFLNLGEQIGRVNVGLSEETISKKLKTSRVDVIASKDKEEGCEICVVCQDEYKVNETIGTLQCGHRSHANCIKEWLLQKNVCPICKATALIT